jgi:type II secretory pathway pseudopilin PulG
MIKMELKKNKGPARTGFRGGFTLLEALVAISILMMAVAAPITIAQRGLSSAVYSKNQMIASYLAQDAIEYVRNARDGVVINSSNFDWNNLSVFGDKDTKTKCFSDSGCIIDTIAMDVSSAITQFDNEFLRKDIITGLYSYDSNDPVTDFSRIVKISMNPDGDSVEDDAMIAVTVNWKGGNSVVVKALIYNY